VHPFRAQVAAIEAHPSKIYEYLLRSYRIIT